MIEKIFNLLINNQLIVISVISAFIFLIVLWKYARRRNKIEINEPIRRDLYEDELYIYDDNKALDEDKTESIPKETEEEIDVANDTDKPTPAAKSEELIIALFVIALNEKGFTGGDIFAVLEEQGLNYGKMRIFHHYGIGEVKTKIPVFSIANMLEPGTFNPQIMEEFVSPGLALFMRLPGPFGGRVAFELMLNKAQRIAEILEGHVVDEQHEELTQHTINRLREQIAHFEGRKT